MNHHSVSSPFMWVPDEPVSASSAMPLAGTVEGKPLTGKRLAVKDLFHIEGLVTTAGHPTWASTHHVANHTAWAVSQLLSAGATLVGKTITDELAYSLNGQNIHYGTPINPVTPTRLPGGSSSGSATAVSANLAEIGLGTDTGGSIRVPASYNGLFGLRPTHGAISVDGLVALAPSFDTVGVMTSTLADLQSSYEILLSGQPQVTLHSPALLSWQNALHNAEHGQQIQQWLDDCWLTADSVNLESIEQLTLSEAFRILQGHEIWQQHGNWITQHKPVFASEIGARFTACSAITPEQVKHASHVQQQVKEWVKQAITPSTVLVIPTTPGCAPLLTTPEADLVNYRQQLLALTALAGLSGLPQLHLPLFTLNGAPCGVSLIGPANSDLSLIALAKTLMDQ